MKDVSIVLTSEQLSEINKQQRKQVPVMERIKTFDDIIVECGKPASYFTDSNLSITELGYRKIMAVAFVYNEGWKADYWNSNQEKWYPHFQYSKPNSSFGFSYTGYDVWFTGAYGGSPLCAFKNQELAKDAGIKFIKEYNEFLNQ